MADTSTERARRHRRHVAGDHSLCLPNRCRVLSPELSRATSRRSRNVAPERRAPTIRGDELGFDESGQRLWDAVTVEAKPGPLQMPLLVEACRIADRLDVLDAQLHGHDWLRFRHSPEDEHEVVVYVDRVLAEAREQATALKGIVAELTKPGVQPKASPKKGGGVLADLAAKRAARSALPAG